jgi:hypothetical protein
MSALYLVGLPGGRRGWNDVVLRYRLGAMVIQLKMQRLCRMEGGRNGYRKKYKSNLQMSLNSESEWCHWKWKSYLRMNGKNLPEVLLN